MNSPPRIAFLGLGRMGAEMVASLTDHGLRPTLWNRNPAKATALGQELGLPTSPSPAAAAHDADIVFTMLTDGPAVLATLSDDDGVLARARQGTVVIDCSTTGADAAAEAASRCAAVGVRFMDCPVSGSTMVARQGKLGLMAGGDVTLVEEVRPVLEALGTVVHVGPTGAGAAAKVAVNALLHTFTTATAECLVTAAASGVSGDRLFDVLRAGVLWNRFLDYKEAAFLDPEGAPVAFDLRTAVKDLALAVQARDEAGLSGSVVERTYDLHRQALDAGFGERDIAAMVAWFRQTAGATADTSATGHKTPGRDSERN